MDPLISEFVKNNIILKQGLSYMCSCLKANDYLFGNYFSITNKNTQTI